MSLIDTIKEKLTGEATEAEQEQTVELHDLSFYCITRKEDAKYLNGMIASLPRGVELVLCNTVHTKDRDKVGIVFDKEEMIDGRLIRFCTYHYTGWHFADARNAALSMCRMSWCFWMDTDDRLMEFQHDDILDIANLPAGIGGVMMGCYGFQPAYKDGERGSFYAVPHCRAHRNHPDIRWRGAVHEQIEPQIGDLGYKVAEADIGVYHVGYVTDAKIMTAKMGRNVRMLCQQIAQDPTYLPDYYVSALRSNSTTYIDMKETSNGR